MYGKMVDVMNRRTDLDRSALVSSLKNEQPVSAEEDLISLGSFPENTSFTKKTFLPLTGHDRMGTNYNRVIRFSIAGTDERVASVLKNMSETEVNLIKLDSLQESTSKRILFLGTASDIDYPIYNRFKQCPICGKYFATMKGLQQHLITIHADHANFKCEKCGKEFEYSMYLEHVRNCNKDQQCTISKIDSSDTYKSNCNSHMLLRCNICDETFVLMSHLDKHLLMHEINKRTRKELCPICGKLFPGVGLLRSHMISHSEDRSYLCEKCPKSFKTKKAVQKHMTIMHVEKHVNTESIGLEIYECSICKRRTKTKDGLAFHMRLKHSNKFTHKCFVCGKGFIRNDYYNRHLNTHTKTCKRKRYITKDENGKPS